MKVGSNLDDDMRRAEIIRSEIGWDNFLVSKLFALKL